MSLQVIIKAFRDAEAASVVIKNFNYGKAWDFNGVPSREYPAILVDSQPDWSVKRQGSNGLPSIKNILSKLLFTMNIGGANKQQTTTN